MINPMKIALVSIHNNPPMPSWVEDELRAQGLNFNYTECSTRAQLAEAAADAELVWVFGGSSIVSRENMPVLCACRYILRSGTGNRVLGLRRLQRGDWRLGGRLLTGAEETCNDSPVTVLGANQESSYHAPAVL